MAIISPSSSSASSTLTPVSSWKNAWFNRIFIAYLEAQGTKNKIRGFTSWWYLIPVCFRPAMPCKMVSSWEAHNTDVAFHSCVGNRNMFTGVSQTCKVPVRAGTVWWLIKNRQIIRWLFFTKRWRNLENKEWRKTKKATREGLAFVSEVSKEVDKWVKWMFWHSHRRVRKGEREREQWTAYFWPKSCESEQD